MPKPRQIDRALLAGGVARAEDAEHEQRMRAADKNQLGARWIEQHRLREVEQRGEQARHREQRIDSDGTGGHERPRAVVVAPFV